MSISPRWLLGIVMLYMILSFLGNTLDMQPTLLTANETATLAETGTYASGTAVGTSGTSSAFMGFLPSTASGWVKMLVWDFSFWYDIDPVTGVQTMNPYMFIIRYAIFFPLMAVGAIMIFIVLRQMVFGL